MLDSFDKLINREFYEDQKYIRDKKLQEYKEKIAKIFNRGSISNINIYSKLSDIDNERLTNDVLFCKKYMKNPIGLKGLSDTLGYDFFLAPSSDINAFLYKAKVSILRKIKNQININLTNYENNLAQLKQFLGEDYKDIGFTSPYIKFFLKDYYSSDTIARFSNQSDKLIELLLINQNIFDNFSLNGLKDYIYGTVRGYKHFSHYDEVQNFATGMPAVIHYAEKYDNIDQNFGV